MTLRDSRDVEQVIDRPHQLFRLPLDHGETGLRLWMFRRVPLQIR
jgi:hypothetical protein